MVIKLREVMLFVRLGIPRDIIVKWLIIDILYLLERAPQSSLNFLLLGAALI